MAHLLHLIAAAAAVLSLCSAVPHGSHPKQQEPACNLTMADIEGPFFVIGAPVVYDLAPPEEFEDKTREIFLEGRVLDSMCTPIASALVEVWYGGEEPLQPYTFRPDYLWYRAMAITDNEGYYRFHATYPTHYDDRPIIHIHYKFTALGYEFVTQMYFEDDVPPAYEDYVVGRETQFPQSVVFAADGSRTVVWDVVMNV